MAHLLNSDMIAVTSCATPSTDRPVWYQFLLGIGKAPHSDERVLRFLLNTVFPGRLPKVEPDHAPGSLDWARALCTSYDSLSHKLDAFIKARDARSRHGYFERTESSSRGSREVRQTQQSR